MKHRLLTIGPLLMLATSPAFAQTAASNKAFFVSGTNSVTLASVSVAPSDITILNAPNAIKTSNVGGLELSLSMECALMTFNTVTVTATSGGGKSSASSSARAAVQAWVEVDGTMAVPQKVTYCDRLQAVGLSLTNTCGCTALLGCTCTVTDTLTLDLFESTKDANSFNFFSGPLAAIVHNVVAKARGIIQCTANGAPVTCPSGTVDAFANAQTAAAIGKRTLTIDEVNNFGTAP